MSQPTLFIYSFGGGSEMMREGDAAGILHVLEHSQKYVYNEF